jgi:glycyl-tRNA synthetase alpha chain
MPQLLLLVAVHPSPASLLGRLRLRRAAALRHGSRRGHLPPGDHAARARTQPWNAAYVQPSRRPTDGRYGENPNRLQHYYQYQVILKPSPPDLQELYLGSLPPSASIRCCTTSASSRTTGKARRSAPGGLAGRCWCDGMEVSQFTYFQQVCGIECAPGLGRTDLRARASGDVCPGGRHVYDLNFNGREGAEKVTYGDVFLQSEQEYSRYNFEIADTAMLLKHFEDAEKECEAILKAGAPAEPEDCTAHACCRLTTSASRRPMSSTCSMRAA